MRPSVSVRLAPFAAALAFAACSSSNSTTPAPVPTPTLAPASTFATIVSPPTQMSGTNQNVTVPTVPGATAGGTVVVTASSPVTAVITTASAAAAGSSSGPPQALQAMLRQTKGFGGTTITPQYYVGVTNTGNTATAVNFSQLNLSVNVPAGQSPALAHYDPSQPQNGWNQHCAFGNGQVSQNGNTTTFNPGGPSGANITIYPGATLWFAPYTYPTTTTAAPTPPPASNPVTPTPAPAPASLTGTYIGSAQQTSPNSQPSQYLEFSLTQSGSSLSGTYAILPGNGNQNGAFGQVSGSVASGGAVTLTFAAQYGGGGSCNTGTINMTASGGLLSGTWANNSGQNCASSGTLSATAQSGSLPTISGNYSGTINESTFGQGTLTLAVNNPGTVWSGTGTVNWPSNPQAGGTSAIVGFVTNATSAYFAVLPHNDPNSGGQGCNASGTITISGKTLNGSFSGSGSGSSGCNGTGTFSITGQ